MNVEIEEKGSDWKIIKSVGTKFGATLNSKELSIALKNNVFDPNAGITLHLKTGTAYPVKLVFKCTECESIHLLACPVLTSEDKKEILGDDIIYIDRSDSKDSYVTIEDLTFLLDNFKDAQDIGMQCLGGEEEDEEAGMFTCVKVMKCSTASCKNAHLTCMYEED